MNFWLLVDQANHDFDDFHSHLRGLSKNELEEFVHKFNELAEVFTDDSYLDFILKEDESITDDSLEDLAGWIVGKGEVFYNSILFNPNLIPNKISDSSPGIAIQYEASKIYFEKFGEHIAEI